MRFLIGLDPGGDGKFGWCLCVNGEKLPIAVQHKGTANHAADAVDQALNAVGGAGDIVGAGIDAPLFWTRTGNRNVDRIVRQKIIRAGAQNASGTVQHINSLRGACLAQGILVGRFLRESFPHLRITESHPKAVMWLLELIERDEKARPCQSALFANYIENRGHDLNEHERDAAIGALTAWAMVHSDSAWQNLYPSEKAVVDVIPGGVDYWMPL